MSQASSFTLSQSLYTYVQAWEVCLRNKLDVFFTWKFGQNWPYNPRFVRNLGNNDRRRLREAIERQEKDRGVAPAPTSGIVADLSTGFWVSQLSYPVPYSWRYNLVRVFPNDPALNSATARTACDAVLGLRNRIAHHEPIYHLALLDRHLQLQTMVAAMCSATFAYAEATCSFNQILNQEFAI